MTDRKMTRAEMVAKADELLADAFTTTQEIMVDKNAAATSRASAVNSAVAIHRALVGSDGSADSEPSEMSYDELQASIQRLRREAGRPSE